MFMAVVNYNSSKIPSFFPNMKFFQPCFLTVIQKTHSNFLIEPTILNLTAQFSRQMEKSPKNANFKNCTDFKTLNCSPRNENNIFSAKTNSKTSSFE